MNNFRELKVWHKSIDLAVEVYKVVAAFPAPEKFNLVSQMQRAAVSVPSNIAEGCGRHSDPAFDSFLSISLGSSYELETQAIISQKLGFIEESAFHHLQHQIVEVQKMTYGLLNRPNKTI